MKTKKTRSGKSLSQPCSRPARATQKVPEGKPLSKRCLPSKRDVWEACLNYRFLHRDWESKCIITLVADAIIDLYESVKIPAIKESNIKGNVSLQADETCTSLLSLSFFSRLIPHQIKLNVYESLKQLLMSHISSSTNVHTVFAMLVNVGFVRTFQTVSNKFYIISSSPLLILNSFCHRGFKQIGESIHVFSR